TSAPSARRISRASSGCSRWSAPTMPSAKRRAAAIASTKAAVTASATTISRAPMAEPGGDSKVPVLTEVVAEARELRPAIDAAALEALARELERAVLTRLAPEIDRVIEEKLARTRSEERRVGKECR